MVHSQQSTRGILCRCIEAAVGTRECDLVIDNSGSLEDTRRRVEELWDKLKQIQQDRKARGGSA